MFLLSLLSICFLLAIVWQDYKYRAVHWWLFVLLFISLGAYSIFNDGLKISAERSLFNSIFIVVQLLFLSFYFSLKERRPVNLLNGYFGLGDLCFLICVSIYLPVINFILFYLVTLLLTILITAFLKFFKTFPQTKIPLAGYQAAFLITLMVLDYYSNSLSLSSDMVIFNY